MDPHPTDGVVTAAIESTCGAVVVGPPADPKGPRRKETQGQIKRLEKIFKALGRKPEAETCPGIEELLEFYNLGAGQKAKRYEITSYENLIDMADKLGRPDAVELLEENLQEEEAALNKLKMSGAAVARMAVTWTTGSQLSRSFARASPADNSQLGVGVLEVGNLTGLPLCTPGLYG